MNSYRVNKDFKDLPFDRVNFKADGKSTTAWTWCQWNYGEYSIENHFNVTEPTQIFGETLETVIEAKLGDLITFSYPVPKAIGEMLERQLKKGRQEAQRAVRDALGI